MQIWERQDQIFLNSKEYSTLTELLGSCKRAVNLAIMYTEDINVPIWSEAGEWTG
jgi:hypothetical protein